MKILLITTMANAPEIERICVEARDLGHEISVYNAKDLKFSVVGNDLNIPGITDYNPDVVITRGILANIKEILTIVKILKDKGVKVFDNNLLNHKYLINKISDVFELNDAGISVVDTKYTDNWDEYYSIAEEFGYPLVVKSMRMGMGKGVYKADTKEELDEMINSFKENSKKAKNYLAQKFFDYEIDLRVLVIADEVFTMRRIPKEGDFRANFSQGGSVEPYELNEDQKELAIRATKALDMDFAGVDLLIGKDGSEVILEVNHTPGFTGMELALGKNIGKVILEKSLERAK